MATQFERALREVCYSRSPENTNEFACSTAELTETVLKTATSADSTAINPRRLFARYLEQYETRELRYLKRFSSKTLADFYESKKHVKRKEFSA